jgi:two-component system response regulator FixJ
MTQRFLYIVDDNDDVRASLESLIATQANTSVTGFASGDRFLEAASSLPPGCLLLDLHMPGASGIDILGEINRRTLPFATIILTGKGDITLAVHAMKLGAIDFLEKPCDPAGILQAVDQAFGWLAKRSAESGRTSQAQAKLALLSPRELDVLRGLVEGLSNKVIAHQLDISPRTVEIYRAKVMEKLEVRSLSEALWVAFSADLLSH